MSMLHKGAPLDLIQTIYMERTKPIVYCFMMFSESLDLARLYSAVSRTAELVPEIFCPYNFEHHRWFDTGLSADDVIQIDCGLRNGEIGNWDLEKEPQLKILASQDRTVTHLQICMSHILTDGAGFLQYLSLLGGFYDNPDLSVSSLENCRKLIPALGYIPFRRLDKLHRQKRTSDITILPPTNGRKEYTAIKKTLSGEQTQNIKALSDVMELTLNDLFMSAYACTIKDYIMSDCLEINLPCPVNLRKYGKKNTFTIANMTGKLRCQIPLSALSDFNKTAEIIHSSIEEKKERHEYFRGMTLLGATNPILPEKLVRPLAKRWFSIENTSYTNVGIIDRDKLGFQSLKIEECYLSGAFRKAPSFQLSISTFSDRITFSSNLICTKEQEFIAEQIIDSVVSILLGEYKKYRGDNI